MALEPITRQEQIIAGKDLEPITRMEKFLKKYGGSGGSGGSGGVSPEEVATIVKDQFPGGVGHETVEQAFAPIVWDGNTEGLESITVNGTNGVVTFCRVAEYAKVTSLSQIDRLGSVILQNGQIAQEDEINLPEALAEYEMEDVFMVSENGWQYQAYFVASNGKESVTAGDVFAETVTFPEGIWFGYTSIPEYSVAQYPTKLTATATTNLATIDPKFLPESHQFGKDRAFEPIAWDCVVDGHETAIDGMYVKISNEYIPIADKSQLGGLSMKTAAGEQILSVDRVTVTIAEHYWGLGDYAICTDGTADFGGTVLSKGLWVMDMTAMDPDVDLTGMTVLPGEIIDTINRKYLPGKVVGILPALPDSTGTYFLDNADAVIQAIKDERDPYLYYYDEANNKHYYYHLNTAYRSNYYDYADFVCINISGDSLEVRTCNLAYSTKRVTGKIYKIATAE